MSEPSSKTDRFPRILFFASAAVLVFGYGLVVGELRIFPYRVIAAARDGLIEVRKHFLARGSIAHRGGVELPFYYREVEETGPVRPSPTSEACHGLNLVTRMDAGLKLSAVLMDMDGKVVHRWDADWFGSGPMPTTSRRT